MGNNAIQSNAVIWERIYSRGEAGSKHIYPCEDLVIAVNRYLSGIEAKGKNILDIGIGCGNNLSFLANRGFTTYGVDVSASAVEIAIQRMSEQGLKTEIELVNGDQYPFSDNFFDVVIAWHVLAYNDDASLQRVLSEIKRILKLDGIFIATFPTTKDSRITAGKKKSDNTFKILDSNQKGGIVVAAETETDVKQILAMFQDLEIGYSEISIKGGTSSHWIIYGKKAGQ